MRFPGQLVATGGNGLQVICDIAIASRTAIFGQVGPRVGKE